VLCTPSKICRIHKDQAWFRHKIWIGDFIEHLSRIRGAAKISPCCSLAPPASCLYSCFLPQLVRLLAHHACPTPARPTWLVLARMLTLTYSRAKPGLLTLAPPACSCTTHLLAQPPPLGLGFAFCSSRLRGEWDGYLWRRAILSIYRLGSISFIFLKPENLTRVTMLK
jgi:hypothetical protein